MMRIENSLCEVCGTCVGVCPEDAVIIRGRDVRIETERCISCGSCVQVCPLGAVKEE